MWWIDCFGDSLKEILEAVRLLGARQVNVWVLEHGGDDLKIHAEGSETHQRLLVPVTEVEGQRIPHPSKMIEEENKDVGG